MPRCVLFSCVFISFCFFFFIVVFFIFFFCMHISAERCFDFGLPAVLGIAFGGFLIGALLIGALWFIKIKTGEAGGGEREDHRRADEEGTASVEVCGVCLRV